MKNFIRIFKALSDETRLRIYLLLLHNELCVCELKAILKIEQSRISHCMRILREADLIESYREGKWNIYLINKKMENNKVIQGLKDELELPARYLNSLQRCKKEDIKNKMKCSK
ncbi:MAG: metalloregulator ArsR/SmtB family transcription factor [Candidatus Caldatribacteriota bacterium]|nr:metalloregulator ArsR/SmtB family transcription factor [Candidatus Caldatribacteriota bacterium]